ncbi:hypothetical protein DYB25_009468 [Aphanomyces astaci]|uniref:Amino acid transporter n=1 Tax=Aphanomyces astaci TaxID=112090 RepID=A0A397A4B4_APHAT|nr:hypothetical protein DYB25_009468 [Aphanomyces astaci]
MRPQRCSSQPSSGADVSVMELPNGSSQYSHLPSSSSRDMLPTNSFQGGKRYSETKASLINLYTGAPGTLLGAGLGLFLGYVVTLDSVYPALRAYDARNNKPIERYLLQPGRMYLRALTCVAIPFAFLSLVLVAAEITSSSRMGVAKLGVRVSLLSMLTSFMVALQGVYIGSLVAPTFDGTPYYFRSPNVAFQCPTPTRTSLFLDPKANNSMVCSRTNQTVFSFGGSKRLPYLIEPTVNRFVVYKSTIEEISSVLLNLTPTNYIEITNTNIMTVALGAVATGVAVGKYVTGFKSNPTLNHSIVPVLRELVAVFEIMTSWIAMTTPLALISLVAGSIYAGTHNVFDSDKATNGVVGLLWYILAFVGVSFVHAVVVLPVVTFIGSRGRLSPLRFMWQMRGALGYTMHSSSSRRSISVLLRTLERVVGQPSATTRFAFSAGATMNKNGAALYVTMSVIFLFSNGGLQDRFSATKVALLVVLATFGSLVVTPVRNGGVVVVVCACAMLTGLAPPYAINFMLIAECIIDPVATMLNAWGNVLIARLVSES